MEKSVREYAIHLNDAIENALELVMEGKKSIKEIEDIIENVEETYGIKRAFILRTNGTIALSSYEGEIDSKVIPDTPICEDCHNREWKEQTKTETAIYGDSIMSINPIENQPSCYGDACHSKEARITGMLMLEHSMQPLRNLISKNIKTIMLFFGGTAVVLIFLFYLLMNKVIFNKLTHIIEIAKLVVERGDITQRIQAMGENEVSLLATSFNEVIQNLEESKKESEDTKDYLVHLINSIRDSILVVDRQYRVVMANKAAVADKNISMEESIGLLCYQVSYHHTGKSSDKCPNYYCPVAKTFDTGRLAKALRTCLDENGETRYIEIYSSPLSYENGEVMQVVEVMRDITERKHLEAQVAYSERLSSLGRIAAGIAHEINNPIAAIVTCVEGLQKRSKDVEFNGKSFEDLPQYLETIKKSAYRCEAITKKMLIFSRQTETILEWVNPNDMIEEVLALVESEAIRARKNITANLAEDIPRIRADRAQLSQVFLNLTHNALDAIDASGKITITTRKANNAIEIIFEDTGYGIAKENLRKIFEPFFTTKPVGEGTGLGLSISEGIIRKHRGEITVSSEVGIGTTFRVVLPIDRPYEEGE